MCWKAQNVANNFSGELEKAWPRKAIGFAIGTGNRLCSPAPQRSQNNPTLQKFLLDNGSFLAGTTPATVYWVSGDELARPEQLRAKGKVGPESGGYALPNAYSTANANPQLTADNGYGKGAQILNAQAAEKEATAKFGKDYEPPGAAPRKSPPIPAPAPAAPTAATAPQSTAGGGYAKQTKAPKQAYTASQPLPPQAAPPESEPAQAQNPDATAQAEQMKQEVLLRNVAPQRLFDESNRSAWSQLTAATTGFRELTTGTDEGVITRFVQDHLEIIFWLRPAQTPEMLFGCLIEAENLRDLWTAAFPEVPTTSVFDARTRSRGPEFILALLDDKTRPVATQPPGSSGRDWKRPFVASEIGEALPHWEAALYLQRPEQLQESARVVRQTLVFLIAAALAIIALGGWLVAADVRRQLELAQQKTDFVSNVSHELKTPLTSIRMFAELMQNGRGETAAKFPQYLRIIMVEAERLTRLINNVLDFARLERKQKHFDKRPLDLHAVIERIWEGHELHLQESGFTTRWQAAPGPYPVIGDEDALAQILVNLLSNAEKYSGEKKEVELHTYLDGGLACVSVLDRGFGVPAGDERKIFESFYRAHDSLSSGIQGSGLGLTLAQQLAREHGGQILYQARAGGAGSSFTLRIPLRVES